MKLSNYFDKVYVINLVTRPDRKEQMISMFNHMGLSNDLMDNTIEFINAVKIPCVDEDVIKYMYDNGKGDFLSRATWTFNVGLFNCSIEHYRIIKNAYLKGYKRILILEDDIRFIKNMGILEHCLETMPDNFDILHLEGFYWPNNESPTKEEWLNILSKTPNEAHWQPIDNFILYDAAALIFSRNGMSEYLKRQEEHMMFSDFPTTWMRENSYFYTYPMGLQQEENFSNIVETTNNFQNINIYLTHINRNDFFNYNEGTSNNNCNG